MIAYKSVSAEMMSEIDKRAREEYGLTPLFLMENAGTSAAKEIIHSEKNIEKANIAILCGKGNNGGDGFVISRYLLRQFPGLSLMVYTYDSKSIKDGPAKTNFDELNKIMTSMKDISQITDDNKNIGFNIIIDAIFGTGFTGNIKEPLASIIDYTNSISASKYAIDIPSGLNGTSGKASGIAFTADKTITFGLAKNGFYINDGPDICGEIVIKDIGFPHELIESYVK